MDYDPLHVTSTREHVNKNKTFKHQEVEWLAEKTNWSKYPDPMENVEVPQENPLVVLNATEVVTPIATSSEVTGKRTFSYAMEIEEEGSSDTSKRKKVEAERELVEIVKTESKKK